MEWFSGKYLDHGKLEWLHIYIFWKTWKYYICDDLLEDNCKFAGKNTRRRQQICRNHGKKKHAFQMCPENHLETQPSISDLHMENRFEVFWLNKSTSKSSMKSYCFQLISHTISYYLTISSFMSHIISVFHLNVQLLSHIIPLFQSNFPAYIPSIPLFHLNFQLISHIIWLSHHFPMISSFYPTASHDLPMFSKTFLQDPGPDDGRGLDAAELLEGHGSHGLHGESAAVSKKIDGQSE